MPSTKRKTPTWVILLGVFFLLAVFDGALRKWVFPEYSRFLYLLKDVVLAAALGIYLTSGKKIRLPRPAHTTWFATLLIVYVFVVCVQSFNFYQPNLAVRILGLKAHLAYISLVVLLPALLVSLKRYSPEQLTLGYMLFVALPVMLLGVYQFFQPRESWINQYVLETQYISAVGGHPRITGTFPYITGMSIFMLFNTFLGFGTFIGGLISKRRLLMWSGAGFLVMCIIVLPMTGSRGPIFLAVAIIPGISLLLVHQKGGLLPLVVGLALLVGVAGVVITQTNLHEGWGIVESRMETATDERERIREILTGPIEGLVRSGLFGLGVGSLHQAAPRIVPGASEHDWVPGGYIENGVVRVILELGALGWLVLVMMKIYAAWLAFEVLKNASSAFEVIVGVLALGEGVSHVLLPVVFFTMASITYWTSMGLMIFVWCKQQQRQTADVPVSAQLLKKSAH